MRRSASPLHDRPHARRLDQVDPYLLIATLLLIGYGLVMTYAVTVESRTLTGDPMQFVIRGAIWAVIGLAVMATVAMFDYAWLGTFAPLVYLFTLGLLGVVLAIGTSSLGAQRSVNFGGLSFQFSEVAKVLMIVVLAKFFADRTDKMGSPVTILGGLVFLGPAVLLVYRQPDLGTSLVFVAIFFGMAFMAGARLWQLVGLVAMVGAALPVIWNVLKPYQQARINSFMDPGSDPRGAGYQILQSKIAVGSGGFSGKGFRSGTQSQLRFLPVQHTDFIFAVIAEEYGVQRTYPAIREASMSRFAPTR